MSGAIIRRPGEGDAVANPVGGDIRYKVRGEQTDGRVLALETIAARGEGPPMHTHAVEDECLFVLEGDVRFRFGDELHDATAGAFVYIPRQTPHAWQNVGDQPARMLVMFTPSGMERFFDGFGSLAAPDVSDFVRLGAEAGMIVVGPPLADSHPR